MGVSGILGQMYAPAWLEEPRVVPLLHHDECDRRSILCLQRRARLLDGTHLHVSTINRAKNPS